MNEDSPSLIESIYIRFSVIAIPSLNLTVFSAL